MHAKAPKDKAGDTSPKKPGRPPKPDWEKQGFRVLVAPKKDYTMGLTVWRKELDIAGVAVPKRMDIPLQLRVLSGSDRDLLLWADADPDSIPAPEGVFKNTRTNKEYHELTETVPVDSEVIEPPKTKRIPCYGCQCRITPTLAAEFGHESLKSMVDAIKAKRLYGKNYAFVDDEEGMKALLPKFADYARTLGWDREDAATIFEFGMDSQIGPYLSEFPDERHRYQQTQDGRLI
jgi:hypothetical protein